MVILGLGSNVGDRLANLRKAVTAIKQIPDFSVKQISPVYLSDALLPDNAPPEWDMPHLNLAMRCETRLEPLELLQLLKKIEHTIGRKPEIRHWGPRILDIDILAWDDLIIQSDILTVPHINLQDRPFALWPLADVAPTWIFPLKGPSQGKTAATIVEKWGSRFDGKAPLHTKQIYQRVDMPRLVGVINVTPDSFSDGGKFLHPEIALQQALYLINSGAEILDIGAESTAPSSLPLNPEKEWSRLEQVLEIIKETKNKFILPPIISIDTRHAETAKRALDFGINWINDVTGLQNPAMRDVIAASTTDCVVMHYMSIPPSREQVIPRDKDVLQIILAWADKHLARLEASGIARSRIIFDPGIGFGKMAEHSFQLIKHIDAFSQLGTRILVGHSRKSFLSLFTQHPPLERDVETLAITLHLAKQPVDFLRVHNVEMCARGLRIVAALEG